MTERRIPKGHSAVMASRQEPPDSLDFFPTPPFATRALCEHVLFERDEACNSIRLSSMMLGRNSLSDWRSSLTKTVWDPASGQGHMAEVLKEYFASVRASDVHDYGYASIIGSFVGEGPDCVTSLDLPAVDWICTNPPFNLALDFALQGLDLAREGVALLVRSVWAEGSERYKSLFSKRPPTIVAQFAERVAMVKGRWDPQATTATSYSWFCWSKLAPPSDTRLLWIPPGCRTRLTKTDDVLRFAEGAP